MQLPNELVLRIIHYIQPADIEALALCNKRIRTLATDALQRHRQLKRKHNKIVLGNVHEYQRTVDHDFSYFYDERSLSLVAYIFNDPDIAYYPTELSLGPHDMLDDLRDQLSLLDEDGLVKYQTLSSRVLLRWDDFISGCSLLRREEKGEWHNALQSSDSKCAAMALLLLLLPNIRHLTLKSVSFITTRPSRIWTIAERIAQTDETTALSKLSRITMDFGGIPNIQAFATFARLPSMRWLDGVAVRGDSEWNSRPAFMWPSEFGERLSKVKKVTFTRSSVHVNALSSFLSGFAALQEFVYYHRVGPHWVYYQPDQYVLLLRHYAGESLVKLDMTSNRNEMYQYRTAARSAVSLQGFSALACVHVDDCLFEIPRYFICTRNDGSRMERLVDVLPKSIVTLEISQHRDTAVAIDLFKDLAELKEERVPQLQEISCWAPDGVFDSPLTGSLKESLERVGIRTSTSPFNITDV